MITVEERDKIYTGLMKQFVRTLELEEYRDQDLNIRNGYRADSKITMRLDDMSFAIKMVLEEVVSGSDES